MKRMGLFGGTFDPIHQGHIDMALMLAQELSLDGVLLVPTMVPPHKVRSQVASPEDRLYMCRLATAGYPLLQVSDIELRRGGASYTVDTLKELHRQYPDTRWYLFTGADMFCTLRSWYKFDELSQMATFCTVPREGTEDATLNGYADALEKDGVKCYVASRPVQNVSSTLIRAKAAAGEDLNGLVPQMVKTYISTHGLYAHATSASIHEERNRFYELVESRLSSGRFHHSVMVARETEFLARRYGADGDKGYIVGMLHDIMKETDPNTQLQILKDFGILLDEVEAKSPKLWHARSGEAFVRNILRVEDEEMLQAIRYHTTGRAGMSTLEKALFVADFTSADRDYPDVEVMRTLRLSSLEEAMEYGIAYTIRELLEKGCAVHPDTLAAYNEIVLAKKTGGSADEKG